MFDEGNDRPILALGLDPVAGLHQGIFEHGLPRVNNRARHQIPAPLIKD